MFIVLEGLDGCGKSTIAQKLAERLSGELISTPGCDFKPIREPLDMILSKNVKARQLFYAATVLMASEKAKSFIDQKQYVVADRYWLSTQVYHNWMSDGQSLQLTDVEQELLIPNLTVYLDLPQTERIQRFMMRGKNTRDDLQTLIPKAEETLSNLYLSMSTSQAVGHWLHVDASKDIISIVDTIMEKVRDLEGI